MNVKETKQNIILAGHEAVKELIKVAKEPIVETDDDISADRLKNAAATKKLAIFDAFEILNRIQEEEDLLNEKPKKVKELKIFKKIRSWATERGLYVSGDPITQYVKLQEEAGELAQALLKDDQPEVIDAIGDMVVVLTNLAHQRGVSIEKCINDAYKVISKRKGKMVNGTFVKETL